MATDQIYQAFGDYVGWRVGQKWLQVNNLTFNLSSPLGHLPAVAVRLGGLSWGVEGFWWTRRDAYVFLLSRKDW
ncbi:MAG: GUN4 domain-containing protein [Stigonema ocellatum SAG 48.90 = DSM 106950]|nr:GUN4 domain-containing protein [Stigonema ocellatum SAG 48.90 = DSM 106950]